MSDRDAVLSLLGRVVELHEEIDLVVTDEDVRRQAQSATLTQWTWLSNYFLRHLDGHPWEVPPLITRVADDVTRWEYGPDKTLTTAEEP